MKMNYKHIIAGTLLTAFVTPAFAADSYYIVQDTSSKRCSVMTQKPTVSTMTVVGDGKVYTSQTEAEGAMKSVTVCQSK
jgi:hypothetical protein